MYEFYYPCKFASQLPSFRSRHDTSVGVGVLDALLGLRAVLAEVEIDLENANGDELELEQYKVTSDNGKTFKSIVYLDRDEDVTGKNFKIIRS